MARAGLEPGTAGLRVRHADHSATFSNTRLLQIIIIKSTGHHRAPLTPFRIVKQQRRRRLRKRHLKNEVARLQTLSCLSGLFCLVQRVKSWQFLSGVEF